MARGFARHLATIDPASEVPATDLLPGHRARIAPYIYTEEESATLMAAAGELRPAMRALRHQRLIGLLAVTGIRPGEALGLDRPDVDLRHGVLHHQRLIGLLAVTGIRPGEALGLDRPDVDLRHGVLQVRAGKQKRRREVALQQSTTSALRRYARQRDTRFPAPSTPAFFISARGRRMARAELNQTFTKLIREVGLDGRGARARPRPYDLRHAFTVRTLLDWHEAGEDIDRRMPQLSTYLGHLDPASTYWYLEAVLELLEQVSRRLERLAEGLS